MANPQQDHFARFAKRTTFHGIREFHESPTCFRKVLWGLIIALCTALLLVFLAAQIRQFIDGQTATKVSRLDSGDPAAQQRPVVWMRMNEWLWIDASKLKRYGVTREELQIAKGYILPDLTYSSRIPVLEAKSRLHARMQEMNAKTIPEFFSLIALDSIDASNEKELVMDKGLALSTLWCMLNTSHRIEPAPFSEAWWFRFRYNFTSYWNNVRELVKNFDHDAGKPKASRPMLTNLDTYMDVVLEPKYSYQIIAEVSIYRKLGSCTKEHLVTDVYFPKTCLLDCRLKANANFQTETCISYKGPMIAAIELTESFRKGNLTLCHHGVMNLTSGQIEGQDEPVHRELNGWEKDQRDKEEAACAKQCIPRCDDWTTTWSVSSYWDGITENISHVEFVFPVAGKLVVIQEIQQYEWHDLVSDLGGLLGLWLGASMMSLFQLVQLCCVSMPRNKVDGVQ